VDSSHAVAASAGHGLDLHEHLIAMITSLQRLLPLFDRESAHSEAMVLATVIHTAGPTYTKPGAQMLIAGSGEYAGLLSGGCLEGDLSERAMRVLATGTAELVRYDMRSPDDLLFGLGSGCEGDMEILLQRIEKASGWQPLRQLAQAWLTRRSLRLLLVTRSVSAVPTSTPSAGELPPAGGMASTVGPLPAGSGIFIDDGKTFGPLGAAAGDALRRAAASLQPGQRSGSLPQALPGTDLLLLEQPPPPRVLLLGAGPDALPVSQLITFLGWSLTVIDHRSHYAQPARFERADAVLAGGAAALSELLQGGRGNAIDAAVVMSHQLLTDLAYLRVLAVSDIPYIGLLGPASRRDRLLEEIGAPAAGRLRSRLRAPVGLDLGATSPEAIALSIVAEMQANIAGNTSMAPLSDRNSGTPTVSAVGERA
jgi:xanthine/CO dehydrogenase XdhC/CoxF family maturation factor